MFVSQFRATALALAALAAMAAAAAASPITLRYDFDALVTSTSYYHWCYDYPIEEDYNLCDEYEAYGEPTTYQGPPLSSHGTGSLTVSFDPDNEYTRLDLFLTTSFPELFAPQELRGITAYDAATRAISLWSFNYSDLFEIDLYPGQPQSGFAYFNYEQNASGANYAIVDLRLYNVTVTDLTEMAPVPLPAALPLLGAGLAGLGWLRRRASRGRG